MFPLLVSGNQGADLGTNAEWRIAIARPDFTSNALQGRIAHCRDVATAALFVRVEPIPSSGRGPTPDAVCGAPPARPGIPRWASAARPGSPAVPRNQATRG